MDKIAITTTSFARYDRKPLEILEENGVKAALNPHGRKLNKEEVLELCAGAKGIIAGTEKLKADTIKELAGLKVISRCGAGLDNVDLEAAKNQGIKVFNTPDAPVLAVAELTIGLILNLLRKVNKMDAAFKQGRWEKLMGNLLFKKKIGIIGFGRIGRKTAELLRPFACEIAYYDPYVKGDSLEFKQLVLKDLLGWADIVSIHISGNEEILAQEQFTQMKKGAWLVNVSRGTAVAEEPLYQALKNGNLRAAAIDVFADEPYQGRLKDLENVILTPHIGSYAKEARVKMEVEAARNLLKGLKEQ